MISCLKGSKNFRLLRTIVQVVTHMKAARTADREQRPVSSTDRQAKNTLISLTFWRFQLRTFNLYLAPPIITDWPGTAVSDGWVDKLNVCGNTLTGGEGGIFVDYTLTNAVVLGNDFTAANLRSIDAEEYAHGDFGAVQSVQLIKNKLAGGDSFQVRAPVQDGTHYFLQQNNYVATNGVPTGLVTEPQSLPVHCQP